MMYRRMNLYRLRNGRFLLIRRTVGKGRGALRSKDNMAGFSCHVKLLELYFPFLDLRPGLALVAGSTFFFTGALALLGSSAAVHLVKYFLAVLKELIGAWIGKIHVILRDTAPDLLLRRAGACAPLEG